jgi:hypothetical protein
VGPDNVREHRDASTTSLVSEACIVLVLISLLVFMAKTSSEKNKRQDNPGPIPVNKERVAGPIRAELPRQPCAILFR